jgi:hypothetical protein
MNIGKIKLYPLAVLVWAATFYMLVVGIHDWRLWAAIVFLFLERILTQIALWVSMYAFKRMATSVKTMLKEAGIEPHAKRN